MIKSLSKENIKLNITAIFTKSQINTVYKFLDKSTPTIISIFAGRITDTGRNPVKIIKYANRLFKETLNIKFYGLVQEKF